MKPIGELEEDLAEKSEPILGIRPSSKFKKDQLEFLFTSFVGLLPSFNLEVRVCFSHIHEDC